MNQSFSHYHEKDLQGYRHSSLCKTIASASYDENNVSGVPIKVTDLIKASVKN